jgi:hypothetical protein
MNIAVLSWWFFGTPWKWFLRKFRKGRAETLREWGRTRRSRLQRSLFMASDTQAVTGIALTVASLMQAEALPLYDLAMVLDLLSISANGQALLLLYGRRQRRISQRERSVDALAVNRPGSWEALRDPRLFISLAYVAIYFAFSSLATQRFNNADANGDCLLNYPPQVGNYGAWGLVEAGLMLILTSAAYLQDLLPESGTERRRRDKWLAWIYDAFLPVCTAVYFIWNLADLITLKIANKSTLLSDTENTIDGFGQIVPVVLLILPLLSLSDLYFGDDE